MARLEITLPGEYNRDGRLDIGIAWLFAISDALGWGVGHLWAAGRCGSTIAVALSNLHHGSDWGGGRSCDCVAASVENESGTSCLTANGLTAGRSFLKGGRQTDIE